MDGFLNNISEDDIVSQGQMTGNICCEECSSEAGVMDIRLVAHYKY